MSESPGDIGGIGVILYCIVKCSYERIDDSDDKDRDEELSEFRFMSVQLRHAR